LANSAIFLISFFICSAAISGANKNLLLIYLNALIGFFSNLPFFSLIILQATKTRMFIKGNKIKVVIILKNKLTQFET